jgi:hypothetical protein
MPECISRVRLLRRASFLAISQSVRRQDLPTVEFPPGKPAGSKSPHPGSALFNTAARSIRSNRSMVRLAHHDRLDLPLVLSNSSRMRYVQDVNCEGTTRLKLALLYWICRRYDKRRVRGLCSWSDKSRARDSLAWGNFHVIILKTSK